VGTRDHGAVQRGSETGSGVELAGNGPPPEDDKLLRFPDRQHHPIEQAEDSRVGADAKTKRKGCDRTESGISSQHPNAISDIFSERSECHRDNLSQAFPW